MNSIPEVRRSLGQLCILALLAFVTFFTGGCTFAYRGSHIPEWSDGHAPELEPLIRRDCAKWVAKGNSVGLTVAVVSETNATVMAFGHRSLSPRLPAQGDTLYEIGSITKTFTALALAREIERGKLSLDQPLYEVLPAGLTLPAPAHAVTLKHLTTHTSGFPRQPGNFPFLNYFRIWVGGNPYAGYSEEEFREAIRTVKLGSKPGTECEYSNFGMDVLGYVLSQRAGTNYEAYIKREVCEPLGLNDTTVTLSEDQKSRFAQGYTATDKYGPWLQIDKSDPWDLPSHLAGSGALRSTASDMLKYLQANMHPEGPLSNVLKESHEELYRDEDISLGMNWVRSYYKKSGLMVIWHNGAMGGACSYLGFTKDGKFGVVLLSNVGMEFVDSLGVKLLTKLAKGS